MCLTACTTDDNVSDASGENSQTSQSDGQTAEYTVSVKTAGGLALAEIKVDIYKDATLADMLDFAKTSETGEVSFSLTTGGEYAIVVSGAPKGYQIESSYRFNGTRAEIVLASSLVTDEELSTATLGLGDVMYDFTVTATDGREIKLSELLKTKDLVVLNFWYTTCSWCIEEFPLMQDAYTRYSKDIAIIALDPYSEDTLIDIKNFQAEMGLTFDVAQDPTTLSRAFGVEGYPTSVLVDRYGVISLIVPGAITSQRAFDVVFEHFTAENYEQKLIVDYSEIVPKEKPNV